MIRPAGEPNKAEHGLHNITGAGLEEECWKNYRQYGMKMKDGEPVPKCVGPIKESFAILEDGSPVCEACLYETIIENKDLLNEAEYQGRKVPLGKPFLTPAGPKKRAVYVRNKKGNVVKVNFGDKKMKIKKGNPKRRKSFRARHKCSQKKDRTTAGYWSCKFW